MKILSIIIPTYNAEKFLDKGLASMILPKETMEELEVIVVNDGTPDDSVAVAQKYVDRYPGTFCILNKENGGHGSGINAGVKAAKGMYFKVIDADDWVDTHALVKTMEALREVASDESKAIDAMVQSYVTYDISLEPAKEVRYSLDLKNIALSIGMGEKSDYTYSLADLVKVWDMVFMNLSFHGLIYNTEFYRSQNYDLVEKVFYEDQEYCTIPLCKAKNIRLMDEAVYIYRIGDVNQSVSTQSMINRMSHFITVLNKELDYQPNLVDAAEGGKEYWIKKLSKFTADIYRVMLIRCDDKKRFRKDAKELTESIKNTSPDLYRDIARKYKIFRLLNRLHMSNETYERVILRKLDAKRDN